MDGVGWPQEMGIGFLRVGFIYLFRGIFGFEFLSPGLALWSRLALNSPASWPQLPSAGVTGFGRYSNDLTILKLCMDNVHFLLFSLLTSCGPMRRLIMVGLC